MKIKGIINYTEFLKDKNIPPITDEEIRQVRESGKIFSV